MKLDEMGLFGREVKISDDAPEHAGEVGRVANMTTERVFVEFKDGKKEWISNRYIVGTRRVAEMLDGDEYPLTEMAAKKQCDKCGKTMAANHYWYKGGWKCKKSSGDDKKADNKPAEKKEDAPKQEKKLKTAEELGLTSKGDGKKRELNQAMKDANEKAAAERQNRFIDQLEKDIAEREAKKAAAKKS